MNFDIQLDTAPVEALAKAIWSDIIPKTTSDSINDSAKDAQLVQRAHQESIFHIRRRSFIQNAVKIKPFATPQVQAARIWIDPPGGQSRAYVITKFEHDTEKFPFHGSRIAVPTTNVPRSGSGIIPDRWKPGNLHLTGHGSGSKALPGHGFTVLTGDNHTVAFFKPGGKGGIFQRDGGKLIPLYFFVPRVRIRPNLNFEQNVTRTVQQGWSAHFTRRFDDAVRHANVKLPSLAGLLR